MANIPIGDLNHLTESLIDEKLKMDSEVSEEVMQRILSTSGKTSKKRTLLTPSSYTGRKSKTTDCLNLSFGLGIYSPLSDLKSADKLCSPFDTNTEQRERLNPYSHFNGDVDSFSNDFFLVKETTQKKKKKGGKEVAVLDNKFLKDMHLIDGIIKPKKPNTNVQEINRVIKEANMYFEQKRREVDLSLNEEKFHLAKSERRMLKDLKAIYDHIEKSKMEGGIYKSYFDQLSQTSFNFTNSTLRKCNQIKTLRISVDLENELRKMENKMMRKSMALEQTYFARENEIRDKDKRILELEQKIAEMEQARKEEIEEREKIMEVSKAQKEEEEAKTLASQVAEWEEERVKYKERLSSLELEGKNHLEKIKGLQEGKVKIEEARALQTNNLLFVIQSFYYIENLDESSPYLHFSIEEKKDLDSFGLNFTDKIDEGFISFLNFIKKKILAACKLKKLPKSKNWEILKEFFIDSLQRLEKFITLWVKHQRHFFLEKKFKELEQNDLRRVVKIFSNSTSKVMVTAFQIKKLLNELISSGSCFLSNTQIFELGPIPLNKQVLQLHKSIVREAIFEYGDLALKNSN